MFNFPNKKAPGDKIYASDFNKIIDCFKRLILRGDGKTVNINHTPNGATISVNFPPNNMVASGGAATVSYSGYFQVEIDSKNNTFSVQHGENIPAFLQINRSVQSIPTVQNMAIIANYLILEITALDAESFNFEYKIIDSINFEEDKVKIIIGRFYSENDKWVFERHYYGGFAQFLTLGGCDGE
ncbi:hypothetical protein AAEX28_04160 [Lentisphaerota bacterium WC36G]|nr:hypothetical protein LJT99_07030 [Lentisphaerae bacterium WC36]